MEVSRRRESAHRRAEYDRLGKKTREREFVEALEGEFEMSPRESRGVLELVGETFFGNREVRTGQVEYTAVRADEGSGKSMEELRKVRVVLTRDVPSDREVQERSGDSAKRKVQILRMTEEAYDQGGLLTQEDLGRILEVSSRTIRRDVVELDGETPEAVPARSAARYRQGSEPQGVDRGTCTCNRRPIARSSGTQGTAQGQSRPT